MLSTLTRNPFPGSKNAEDFLWPFLVFLFPLIFWIPGYDSFHEPKWLFLTAYVGLIVLLRVRNGEALFSSLTPLTLPLLACLGISFFSLRWMAGDRWVAFALWVRLPLVFLLIHLLVSWIRSKPNEESKGAIRSLLSIAVGGGCSVALFAILQDWKLFGWGTGRVSDWRFHLNSTLGNPNEVGGYICYLMPVVLARWFSLPPHKYASLLWWGLTGLFLLYGLTTVFTVGAWLGLFVVLPLAVAVIPGMGGKRWKGLGLAASLSTLLFGLLQLSLSESFRLASRTMLFLSVIVLLILMAYLITRWLLPEKKGRTTLAVAGLLIVWGLLLPPWGIPNHPDGLISEALASPRWKGGFGARRFIWTTTALMIKDHPFSGIGWGHYFTLHNLYQGEIYRQRGFPHDRPSVGLVPQAHSDPLQVVAETGVLGGIAFFWLVGAVILLWVRRIGISRKQSVQLDPELNSGSGAFCGSCTPTMASGGVQLHQKGSAHEYNSWASSQTYRVIVDKWACGAGLLLIFFHSLVDFPFRQPQPVLLAAVYLAILASSPLHRNDAHQRSGRGKWSISVPSAVLGLSLVLVSAVGLRDQRLLKQGYEGFLRGIATPNTEIREDFLQLAGYQLDSILYPLPETHDRWLYRAQVALQVKDLPTAEQALMKAGKYRHTLALYEAWMEYGKQKGDPKISLGAVRGLLLYNPCWAGYHDEEARLLRILGQPEEAEKAEQTANRLRVPEKPGP